MVLYLVGLIGILSPFHGYFIVLSPINLFLSAIIIFPMQQVKSQWFHLIAIFILGYFVELLGIRTGIPFGHYHYGSSLTPLLMEVPIIIGLNWWILAFGSTELASRFSRNRFIQPLFASVIMTSFDLILEQVAPKLDFWHWEHEAIPIQNFIGWFLVSLIFNSLIQKFYKPQQKNRLAERLFAIQAVFFLILMVLL